MLKNILYVMEIVIVLFVKLCCVKRCRLMIGLVLFSFYMRKNVKLISVMMFSVMMMGELN